MGLKDDLSGQIVRLRAEYDEKIIDYEARLQKALSEKVEKMLEMGEEVEVEYADKMEDLRNMYRDEMNNQVSLAEKEKEKMQALEKSLQESLRSKRKEFVMTLSRKSPTLGDVLRTRPTRCSGLPPSWR